MSNMPLFYSYEDYNDWRNEIASEGFRETPSWEELGVDPPWYQEDADATESDVAEHEVKAIEELRRRVAVNDYVIRSSTPAAALWCFGVDDIPF